MLVLRSLTLGLLVATVWMSVLFVTRNEPCWHEAPRPAAVPAPPPAVVNNVTVIDLAALPDGQQRRMRDIAELVHLERHEAIVAVDDRPVTFSIACSSAPHYCMGAVLGSGRYVEGLARDAVAGSFVDFTVASSTASRRVLVLVH